MATHFDDSMSTAAEAFSQLPPAPTSAEIEQEDLRQEEEDAEDENPVDPEGERHQDTGDDEGDEPESSDEQDEEPAEPAIDPPVSWDAEAKAVFATLPPEAQRIVADRESQRDKLVNTKAMEAAQHRKAAETVTHEYTQLHRQYAEQLATYAQALQPQRPDYSLIATNPAAYAQQMAEYEAAIAQRDYLTQQSTAATRQADTIAQQQAAYQAQQDEALLTELVPEYSDPVKRTEFLTNVIGVARELGWPDDLIAQARPHDILAVKQAASWKADAEKWRGLQKAKMEPVRAAKTLPKVTKPGSAQPKGSARAQGLQDSLTRLRSSGDVNDAAAAFRNLR
jgi:hypothetical protein